MKISTLQSAARILVYGYGREGRSTEQWLQATCPTTQFDIRDDHDPQHPPVRPLSDYDVIILSPGIDPRPLAQFTPRLTSQTEIFFTNLTPTQRQRVIGITGTKGKSTTSAFTAALLQHTGTRVALGGNFGQPVLELWPALDTLDWIVLELSSYQLERLPVSPAYALCTNLMADHLDRYDGSLSAYHTAKSNLWRWQAPSDHLFVPDSAPDRAPYQSGEGQLTVCPPLGVDHFPPHSPLRALHFRQNFGLVAALAQTLDIPPQHLTTTCQQFQPLPHRLQSVATVNDITFVNDSISTNPTSCLAAVRHYADRLGCLILGGLDRGLDFTQFGAQLASLAPHTHILLPEGGLQSRFTALCQQHGLAYHLVTDLPAAVQLAHTLCHPGQVCLLSPCAPSFDIYPSFVARGEHFQRICTGVDNGQSPSSKGVTAKGSVR